MKSVAARIAPSVVLLLGSAILATGCNRRSDEEQCAECKPNFAYRCPVPSTNNVICAADIKHAVTLCPEGPIPLCEGGSGGQADEPSTPTPPDAKVEAKQESK